MTAPESAVSRAFLLAPGEGRTPAPLNIVGESTMVKVSACDTAGALALFHLTAPRFTGPPLHVHTREDELFYVLDGTLVFEIGGVRFDGTRRWCGVPAARRPSSLPELRATRRHAADRRDARRELRGVLHGARGRDATDGRCAPARRPARDSTRDTGSKRSVRRCSSSHEQRSRGPTGGLVGSRPIGAFYRGARLPGDVRATRLPYGIYDLRRNTGFVNVGADHDTGAFAVTSIRGRCRAEGRPYPRATRVLITADGRPREIQRVARRHQQVRVERQRDFRVTRSRLTPARNSAGRPAAPATVTRDAVACSPAALVSRGPTTGLDLQSSTRSRGRRGAPLAGAPDDLHQFEAQQRDGAQGEEHQAVGQRQR